MMSPAREHRLRVLAKKAANANEYGGMADNSAYTQMRLKLHQDKTRLKRIQSLEGKVAVKREVLPEYCAWVDGALQGEGAQDDVLMTVLVWRIDVGDWQGALDIARHALRFNLAPPDHYQRPLPCLIAEELADQAPKPDSAMPLQVLQDADHLLTGRDMPDPVRAKLEKALGYAWNREAAASPPETVEYAKRQALAHLERALQLHDKAGVKKDIERLQRDLKNLATAAETPVTES
ncbi:phage terminase small subunit [Chitinimonas sp. PSY-7]|uniref:phage terminase small subunit n=1 Tax=Chitinimonas sp. PSY-7 TaxID=3459088 RepID=UPI00404017DD